MSRRETLLDLVRREPTAFADAATAFLAESGATPPRQPVPTPAAFDGPADGPWDSLLARERRLVWKAWVLADAPFGVTVAGAAYEDNPLLYANRTFREMTGYPMADLRGENPRLLQGPETDAAAVADLHEALRTWEPATVELRNYRADGTPFRNRVSLLPVTDEAGTVTNWLGVQRRVDE